MAPSILSTSQRLAMDSYDDEAPGMGSVRPARFGRRSIAAHCLGELPADAHGDVLGAAGPPAEARYHSPARLGTPAPFARFGAPVSIPAALLSPDEESDSSSGAEAGRKRSISSRSLPAPPEFARAGRRPSWRSSRFSEPLPSARDPASSSSSSGDERPLVPVPPAPRRGYPSKSTSALRESTRDSPLRRSVAAGNMAAVIKEVSRTGSLSEGEAVRRSVSFQRATSDPPPLSSRGRPRPEAPSSNPEQSTSSRAPRIQWEDLKILRPIGSGATAEVYEAEWQGQTVAVKKFLYRCEEFTIPEVERFKNEIATMERCQHPSVVKLLAVGDSGPELFAVMELCPGGTLGDASRARRRPPSEGEAAAAGAAVARALAHLHSLEPKVVHRDLKPENVFVAKDGSLRIGDFGSATSLARAGPGLRRGRSVSMKRRMGDELSFFYVAPEVIRDEPADEKVDVYALGILLYELSTGRRPFEGSGMSAIAASMAAAVDGLRPAFGPGEGGALGPVIRLCWDQDAAMRPTAAQAARLLEEVARRHGHI